MKSLSFKVAVWGATLAAFFLAVHHVEAATPGDSPQGANGAVQVVCDDGGTANATAVPSTPLNRRNSIGIQNLGPNPIYCGFANTVTSATGTQVASSGGYWNPDIRYLATAPNTIQSNPKVYCKQTTCSATVVNQVADGGASDTRYAEVQ